MNLPNEDIPVRVAEDEEVEANTEYDPDCCARNDSDENEIEHSDEDIWHDTKENDDDDEYGDEPTFYDSGMWASDCSFDHHNTLRLMSLLSDCSFRGGCWCRSGLIRWHPSDGGCGRSGIEIGRAHV